MRFQRRNWKNHIITHSEINIKLQRLFPQQSPKFCHSSHVADKKYPSSNVVTHWNFEGSELKIVEIFCYPGDAICKSDWCEVASIFIVRVAWGQFSKLFSMNSPSVSFHRHDQSCKGCVCGGMPYTSDCWVIWSEDLQQIIEDGCKIWRKICKS